MKLDVDYIIVVVEEEDMGSMIGYRLDERLEYLNRILVYIDIN